MTAKREGVPSPWISVPLGLLIIGFAVMVPLGIMGVLGNTFGAVCIGLLLVFVTVVMIAWVVKVVRAARDIVDRNDPKSARYRG